MNSHSSSPERVAEGTTDPGIQPPTRSFAPPGQRSSANDEDKQLDDHSVNPLWMITVALGILVGVMALFVATG